MLSLKKKRKKEKKKASMQRRERTRGVCTDLTKKRSRKKDCGLRNMLVITNWKVIGNCAYNVLV